MNNSEQKAVLHKANVIRSGSWEGKTFALTQEYITAVENLLKAEINMMRQVDVEYVDCWYCGAAKINDMSSVGCLELSFGSKEDAEYVASDADIFVTVD